MAEINETYEYSVTQKAEGKWRWRRAGLIALYVLMPVITLILIMGPLKGMVYMGAFIVLADAVLIFFTWRLVSVEYSYEVTSGKVTFTLIQNAFNHRIKKPKAEFMLRECSLIAPLREPEYEAKYREYAPETVISALSSEKAEDAYFALYSGEDGKRCAFLFEATNDMLKRCRFYNREATVVRTMRY